MQYEPDLLSTNPAGDRLPQHIIDKIAATLTEEGISSRNRFVHRKFKKPIMISVPILYQRQSCGSAPFDTDYRFKLQAEKEAALIARRFCDHVKEKVQF